MANFTLREPPEESGVSSEDIKELMLWCRELYDSIWLAEFSAAQQRKKKKGTDDEG